MTRKNDDDGFTLIEVLVAMLLAGMLSTMLMAMTISTLKAVRVAQERSDSIRTSAQFDASFEAAFRTATRVRQVSGGDPAHRTGLVFDFTTGGDCAVMTLAPDDKPVDGVTVPVTTWKTGFYVNSLGRVHECDPANLATASVQWLPAVRAQPRPITITLFDGAGQPIQTTVQSDSVELTNVARVDYSRLKTKTGTAEIVSSYALPTPSRAAAPSPPPAP